MSNKNLFALLDGDEADGDELVNNAENEVNKTSAPVKRNPGVGGSQPEKKKKPQDENRKPQRARDDSKGGRGGRGKGEGGRGGPRREYGDDDRSGKGRGPREPRAEGERERREPRGERREYDRKSGSGKGNDREKRSGGGRFNWGSETDGAEKAEKTESEEVIEEEPAAPEEPDNEMTLAEYKKQQAAKKANVAKGPARASGEGAQVSKKEAAYQKIEKVEEGSYFEGMTKEKKTTTKKEKVVVADNLLGFKPKPTEPVERDSGKGKGKGKGGSKGKGGGRGGDDGADRRGPKGSGGRGGGRSGPTPDVEDESAFPSLGGK